MTTHHAYRQHVVGWHLGRPAEFVAGCTCGWKNGTTTRFRSTARATWVTHRDADTDPTRTYAEEKNSR